MSRLVLTVLLSITATVAQAGESKFSLQRCGLQFGEQSSAGKTYSARKKGRDFASDQVVRSIENVQSSVNTFAQTTTKRKVRRRMPPTFTVAKFVCSL
ncbi:MAG: hypothetical protein AB8B81_09365 [Halioglobus sp.]